MSHTEGKIGHEFSKANNAFEIAPIGEDGLLDWSREICITADNNEADARRLVACWNEHDGLVHDNARLYESLNSEMRARIEAEKERDELVVALRKFNHDVLEEFAYAPNPGEVEAILAKYPEAS